MSVCVCMCVPGLVAASVLSVCTHSTCKKKTDLYFNAKKKKSNRSQNVIPAVNQVTGRAICPCTHSTTGFGMEINLIWIQSDSLLHSVQWSEEWCLEAPIDLQSERDSHQTDAPSLSAGS